MALIEEDGTGKSTAESYCTGAFADAYFLARGNAAWAALTTAAKEAALRRASEYMTGAFSSRWQGVRAFPLVQALDWPRWGVVFEGYYIGTYIVPEIIKRACCELALKASTADLQPDLTQGVISEQVGSIGVTYDKNSPQATRYKAIDAMLAPFLKAGGGCSVSLVRT